MTDELMVVRCDDCGHMTALPRSGGDLPECCDMGEARETSILRVPARPEWWVSSSKITGGNPIRATLTGPPALCWIQGRDAYGLYVRGKRVGEWEGVTLDKLNLGTLNDILKAAYDQS